MAVKNQLAQAQKQSAAISYKVGGQEITLNGAIVKKYLISGDSDKVTDQEIMLFLRTCQYQGLNPFLREAYLVKYGSSPAQIVTGKGALEKRAARCVRYRGFDAGIIVRKQDGTMEYRTGTFCMPDEQLVGGWADVYVDGFAHPVKSAVSLTEYNTGKSVWAQKPATMIRKVAKVQALREAFPEDMAGMYEAEEYGISPDDLPNEPVQQDVIDVTPEPDAPAECEPYDDFASIMEG